MTNKSGLFSTGQPIHSRSGIPAAISPGAPPGSVPKSVSVVSGGIVVRADPEENDEPIQENDLSEAADTWGGFDPA
jgi:hypothetical protein